MRLTYITHDEVNAAYAEQLARRAGLELLVNDIREQPMTSWIVCDLDSLPVEYTRWLLQRARGGEDLSRVAVHSYNLTSWGKHRLRLAGTAVSRRLSARLLLGPQSCCNGLRSWR